MKKIALVIILVISFFIVGCGKEKIEYKYNIVVTSFPGYDFTRAVIKDVDDINVEMLLKPGVETHDFEPTPQDIINIKNSDIFIYVGGESDSWIDNITKDLDLNKTKIIKLMDIVDLFEEETVEGMEEEDEEEEAEYDEHIWTSPNNAVKIINVIKEEVEKIDVNNSNKYEENANNYINQLKEIDNEIRDIVNTSKRKEIVFGDRFPLRYFVEEYGLSYRAAFPGCAHETEVSAKTLSYLINYVSNNKIPAIFHIELSNGKIADTIAKETGTKVLEFHSAHNISKKDFEDEITYVDLYKKNIEALKEALN